ncbi:MAG: hypothetical protein LBT23_05320 [Synergistaceae bacterium]|jgi:hypothetical protein|nr:hypothetical protein [Synergistaceae bacterium]
MMKDLSALMELCVAGADGDIEDAIRNGADTHCEDEPRAGTMPPRLFRETRPL